MAKNTAPMKGNKSNAAVDDEFSGGELQLDTFQYKLDEEACRNGTLQGFLFDYVRMPDADRNENPEWYCFAFKLTAPCTAFDRNGDAHDCKPGDIVLLNAAGKLKKSFGSLALAEKVTNIRIEGPWKKVDIGGGKKMWSPAKVIPSNKGPRFRAELGLLPPVGPNVNPNLNGKTGAAQLPQGGQSDAAEAPF
jgi:hypothetical protein